ncbi:MAG: hypothetical protein AB7Y74_01895 [Syntrophorhabdus sp.]|jgi:hypothetical protein|nr:hypothetical protein [Syntrophaceae bacterium]HQO65055.1 hypothetical protein [Syntrophorhabdus sp.]
MSTQVTAEMANVVEFIAIRQRIELLAKQIESTTAQKEAAESALRLDEATKLLVTLAAMASNDVQEIVIGRLTRQLVGLGIKVKSLTGKKRASKKQPAV